MKKRELLRAALAVTLAVAGCGDASNTGGGGGGVNTAGYSGPVNIRIDKFKPDEARNGVFDNDKSVNTESGNPYGAFLQAARAALGRDPAAVLVDRVTLTIDRDTRGVSAFEQVLGGPLTVYLASSSTTVNIGTVTQPTGAGPVEVTITATRDTLAPINARLLDGGFKVGIRVPVAAAPPRDYDLRIATTLYFRALIF